MSRMIYVRESNLSALLRLMGELAAGTSGQARASALAAEALLNTMLERQPDRRWTKGLSCRARNVLYFARLECSEDVRAIGRDGLLALRHCGSKTADEIMGWLDRPREPADG